MANSRTRRALFRTIGSPGRAVELTYAELIAHWILVGLTRSGKTIAMAAKAINEAIGNPSLRLFVLDWVKNDLCAQLRDVLFPALAARHPQLRPNNVASIRPFGGRHASIVPVDVLAGEGSPKLRALVLTNLLAGAHVRDALSVTMSHTLMIPTEAVLSARAGRGNETALDSILDILELVRSASYRAAYLRRVPDPELRKRLETFAPPEMTVAAVARRLELLLSCDEVRLLIASPRGVSLSEIVGKLHVLVDLTGAPAGAASAVAMVGRLLFAGASGVMLRRRPTSRLSVFLDEAAETARGVPPADLERILSQAASRGVSMTLGVQCRRQLSDASPLIEASVFTNCAMQAYFQTRRTDLLHVRGLLERGLVGGVVNARLPDRCYSSKEELERVMRRATSLPRRHLVLARLLAGHALMCRTADLPLGRLRAIAEALPEKTRLDHACGVLGKHPSDLPKPKLILDREQPAVVTALTGDILAASQRPRRPQRQTPRLVLP